MTDYDEARVHAFVADAISLFMRARVMPNPRALIWVSRFQFDAVALGYAEAHSKHLAELGRSLGLRND